MVGDIFESGDIRKMGKLGKNVLTIMKKYDAGNRVGIFSVSKSSVDTPLHA